ncbi:peptide-methionine (S)-S-oxide reductase [Pontibacter aydingkolensis]|uniref:Peptide methionine sulfoxide reductase MsrA n=1 Tax=Pontibacter aydingkolensis TaxID=1911536 RepID=A0ABS7CZP8_9BACT|nr:peptide-methionine (S)-S-oxide reductase MsrA [Pontibacter aydingkolensis]MBW7469002.1 peptide-methionine (S)-S-oxide reductase MsrA [Pontibacter aydingkolensis]
MAILFYTLLPLILLLNSCTSPSADQAVTGATESDSITPADTTGLAKATFAGGCFWCTEAYFERLKGVEAVVSGYAGGTLPNPTYVAVSAGRTDYAEAVQVYYHPDSISFETLVEVFFATHDPTTLNRQGPDVGEQYRSVAFYRTPQEKEIIGDHIQQLTTSGKYKNKIVTYVQLLEKFWVAEEYHQDYYRRNPSDPYVVSVAKPKVQKFEAIYKDRLKAEYMK